MASSDDAASARYGAAALGALLAYNGRFSGGDVSASHATFFLNWHAQAARATADALATRDPGGARTAVDCGLALSDCLAASRGPLHAAAKTPMRMATVEVACALEGLADALAIASDAGDIHRVALYRRAASSGLRFLLRLHAAARDAVAAGQLPPPAMGGFGAALAVPWQQRCDVTAHAVAALLKLLPGAADDAEQAGKALEERRGAEANAAEGPQTPPP